MIRSDQRVGRALQSMLRSTLVTRSRASQGTQRVAHPHSAMKPATTCGRAHHQLRPITVTLALTLTRRLGLGLGVWVSGRAQIPNPNPKPNPSPNPKPTPKPKPSPPRPPSPSPSPSPVVKRGTCAHQKRRTGHMTKRMKRDHLIARMHWVHD